MKMILAFLLILIALLSACTGSLPEAKRVGATKRLGAGKEGVVAASPERCATLDDRRQLWGAVGKASALLAGVSGISTIPVHDTTERDALAAGALGFAAIAAGAQVIAEGAGESWVEQCSGPSP